MKVLIADKFPEHWMAGLKTAGAEVVLNPELKEGALLAAIKENACNVLVVRSTKVNAEMLGATPELKLVIRAGSGYDTIDHKNAAERGISVANCPGKNSVAVAELTIGLMVALDRRIVDGATDLRKGVWNKKEYGKARGLKGRTLGVVGLGRIGYELAKRAKAFEMKLIYSDVVDYPDFEKELGIRKVSFDAILAESDFISLHVPGGDKTKHIIGAGELAKMKPTAFVINCSRGGTVDEVALAKAVESGKLGGAALDVYEIEPAATDKEFKDPVVNAPRIYGTHHIGASTAQAQDAVAEEVVKIVRTFAENGEVLNCVNRG